MERGYQNPLVDECALCFTIFEPYFGLWASWLCSQCEGTAKSCLIPPEGSIAISSCD